jgi:hypothetical protein
VLNVVPAPNMILEKTLTALPILQLHCVGGEGCVGWNDLRHGNREKNVVRHSRIFCFENLPKFF